MRVSKAEFNIFWDEVLGDDWYIDNDDLDNDFEDEHEEDISDYDIVSWCGKGQFKKGDLPNFVKPSEVDDGPFLKLDIGLETLFRRWKKSQSHTTFCVHFTIEKTREAELRATLKKLGAKF